MRTHGVLVVALIVALSVAPASQGKYKETAVTNGGAVAGSVKFSGAVPPRAKLTVDKDLEVCGKGGDKLSEALVVSPAKEIKNVVVTLEGIAAGKKFSTGRPRSISATAPTSRTSWSCPWAASSACSTATA